MRSISLVSIKCESSILLKREMDKLYVNNYLTTYIDQLVILLTCTSGVLRLL